MPLPRLLRPLIALALWLAAAPLVHAQPLQFTAGPLGPFSVGPMQIQLTAQGGVPPYTWSHTGGTLPPGTAVRADVPPWFPPNSAALSGVTTGPGDHTFTLTVTDSAMPTPNAVAQTFTLAVTSLTIADNFNLPDGFVGLNYDYAFTVAGAVGAVTIDEVPWGPVPPGMSILNGHLQGAPSAPGFFNFQVRATSGGVTVYRGFSVNVFGIQITTPGTLPNAQHSVSYSTTFVASGGAGAFTWQSSDLPAGFSLNAATGTLTVASPQQGDYFFHVTASDGTHSHTKNFMLTVRGPTPTLPEIHLSIPLEDFTIGEPRSIWVGAGGGVPPYTFSVSGLPAQLAFAVRTSATTSSLWPNQAEVTGTALALGTYSFSISVTDSSLTPVTVTRPVTLRVKELTFDYPNASFALNTVSSIKLRVYGGTGSAHSATLLNPDGNALPTGVTFNGATLVFSGTPLEWGGYNSRLNFTDGQGHTLNRSLGFWVNGGTSNVNIGTFPRLPDATHNQFYSFNLWSCCAPNVTWSEVPGFPLPGGLSVAPNGAISGTPALSGEYTFRIRATNAATPADFVIRQFHLRVTPVVITTNSNLPFANKDSAYDVILEATGGATGFTWQVEADSELPPGLSLVFVNGVWKISGMPTSPGRFSFHLRVSDQSGNSRRGFFSVEIYPPGATPPVSFAMGQDFGWWSFGQVEIGLHANGGDGNYVWSVIDPTKLPPGVLLRSDPAPWFPPNTKGTLAGIATTPGTYTFDLRVTSAGQTITSTFTIRITSLQAIDPHQLPDAFVGEDYSYTFTTTSVGSPFWEVQQGASLPPGLTLNQLTGTLQGQPTTEGTYSLGFRITDGPAVAFAHFQLVVSGIQINAPALMMTTQGQAVSHQFSATGPAGTYAWSATGLPPGFTLSAQGLLSGVQNFPTTNFVMLTATNTTTGRFYTKRITIHTVGVPRTLPSLGWFQPDDWTVGMRRSINITASGGVPPYAWSLQNAPLAFAHMRLRTTGLSPWAHPGQAELFGVIQTAGTYTFDVSVTDSSPQPVTVTRTFTLRVSELMLSGFGPIPLTYGATLLPTTLRVIGGRPVYVHSVVAGKLPAGMTISTAGTLSGTPLETGNTFSQLLITDADNRELRTGFGLFVGAGPLSAVQINSHFELTATQNQFSSMTLFACCLASSQWTLEPFEPGESLPAGLTLSAQGVLSGTPTASGVFRFRARVFDPTLADPNVNFAIREFVLTVTPLTYPGSTNLSFFNVGTLSSRVLAAPAGSTGPVTWSEGPGSQLPPGLSLSFNAQTGEWAITGTPLSAGQFFFSLVVSQGGFSRRVFFQVGIYPAGQKPPLNLSAFGTFGPFRVGRVQVNLPVFDGEPPYNVAYVPGFEIPGVRVQNIGEPQPTFVPANTGTLLGVITAPGTYQTRVRATDSAGGSIERDLSIVVSPLAVTTVSPLPDGAIGVPYTHTLTAVGGTGSYLWTGLPSAMPPGLTMSTDGTISGTPTTAGGVGFMVRADDGTTTTPFSGQSIRVHPFAITTNAVLPIATQGTTYSLTFSGAGCPCTWNLAGGNLPGGLSLTSAGVLSGTPNNFGTSVFTIQATAGTLTSRKVFTAHVRPSTPQPITRQGLVQNSTTIGQQYVAGLFMRGGVAPYTWAHIAGTLPPGLALLDGLVVSNNTGAEVAYLAGIPTALGTYTFTVRFTDSSGGVNAPVDEVFSVLVSPIGIEYRNLPLPNTELKYNTPYSQRFLAIGGSGSYSWGPAGEILPGLFLAPTDLVSGTPLNTGSFNVPIQVTDTVTTDTLTQGVNFNIASNTPATLTINTGPNLGVVQQGFSGGIGLFAFGGPVSPPRVFTFSVAPGSTLPPGFALVSGESFPGGPGAPGATQLAFTALQTGTFSFTLEVRDQDFNFGAKTMTITVSPHTIFTNGVLPDASVVTGYNQPLHAWGANATWFVAPGSALPPGVNLVNGVLTGTPTTAGTYSFTLRTCDPSQITCVARNFTLRVAALALTDAGVLPIATLGVPYSHTFAALGGGTSKSFTLIGSPPAGLSTAANGVLPGGLLSGTPTFGGTFTLTVQVSDGVSTFVKTFRLYVRDPNPALLSPTPSSGSDTRFVTVGQSFSYSALARLGTPPYTWALTGGTLPPGIAIYSGATLPSNFAPDSFVLAGAPTTVGTSTLLLTATDANNKQTTVRLTLVVTPVSLVLNSLRPAIYNTDYAQQLVAAGGTGIYTQFKLVEDTVLPTGLSLSLSGRISGTPTDTGNFNFIVEVTDTAGAKARRNYNIFVRASSTSTGLDLFSGNIGDITAGTGMAFTLRANGAADTSVTWALKAGNTLPAGVELLSGGTLPAGQQPGTALLAGVPTTPGAYAFAIQATDGAANFGERSYTMRVSPIQILSIVPLRDAAVGALYTSDPLVVVGAPNAQYTLAPFINNVEPPGLSWDSTTGVLSGTPTVAGNFVLTVRILAGGFRLQRNLAINIAAAGQPTPVVLGGRVFPDSSIGVPVAVPLDIRASGGSKPYTWAASGLPPGITLVPGMSPHSSYLVGSPTTPGDYSFTLTVQDGAGQSATGTFRMHVSAIRFPPDIVPTASVGSPFSLTFTATGGTGPYAIVPLLGSSLPPNLSRSISGATVAFSGTPTVQGRFGAGFRITDTTGQTLTRTFAFNIDSPTTPSPYLSLNPTSVQITYVIGGGAPAPVPVDITSSSNPVSFTAMLANVPSGFLSVTSGTTPRTTNIVLNASALDGLGPATYYGVLAANSAGAILPSMAIPVKVTVLPPPPCEHTLGSTSATFGSDVPAGGQAGSFSLTTGGTCSWTATSDSPSWLRVDTASGTGGATIGYTVLSDNTTQTPRVGTITVEDKTFTVTQFGMNCSFILTPTTLTPQAGGATDTVIVNPSQQGCTWTVSSSDQFIAQVTPGAGQFQVTTHPTIEVGERSATITVYDSLGAPAGSVNVTQAGLGCGVTLSDSSISLPAGGDVLARSGSVSVTNAPCGYNTVAPPQVTITGGGSSSFTGVVSFYVAQNVSTQSRSLTMQIGDKSFVITQPGMACDVSVSGSNPMFNAGGGSGSLSVTANVPTCDWSAASGAPWVIIDTGHTGQGSGGVTFSVAANSSPVSRSTSVTVGGQSVQINQAGLTCTYNLRSTNGSVPATGGTGSVGVVAAGACTWSATSNAPWIAISSSDDGGTGYVSFLASANLSAAARSGTMTVAGQIFTVTQSGAPCSYTLSTTSGTVSNIGGSGSFTFATTTAGCTPTVQSYSNWIQTTSTFAGTSGTVAFTVVDPNPFGISRSGHILVGDQTFTVTQQGAACMYSLHAPSATFGAAGGSGELLASGSATGCKPAVGASPEITLGTLVFPPPVFNQPYTVQPFVSSLIWVRTLSINFGGITFAVKQTSW